MKIHPLADVQSADIGTGTVIWQYSVVLPGAVIGKNCNINAHCFIENDVVIGDNVTVKCGVYLWDGLRIGNNVQIGPNATFVNDLYPRAKQSFRLQQTTLCDGVSVGASVTVLGGVTVNKYALIGAGSLVTKDIPPYSLWFGNPAVFKGYICTCGRKLNETLVCECGRQYFFDEKEKILKEKI
jgi:UDP-2-acetamido-3-amino-2,3-dideoxy-glucuronate N-acetyltransferase